MRYDCWIGNKRGEIFPDNTPVVKCCDGQQPGEWYNKPDVFNPLFLMDGQMAGYFPSESTKFRVGVFDDELERSLQRMDEFNLKSNPQSRVFQSSKYQHEYGQSNISK